MILFFPLLDYDGKWLFPVIVDRKNSFVQLGIAVLPDRCRRKSVVAKISTTPNFNSISKTYFERVFYYLDLSFNFQPKLRGLQNWLDKLRRAMNVNAKFVVFIVVIRAQGEESNIRHHFLFVYRWKFHVDHHVQARFNPCGIHDFDLRRKYCFK